MRRTVKRKNMRKRRTRSSRRRYRIQRGGGFTEKQITELCLPPHGDWKNNLSNYISIHIGMSFSKCLLDESSVTEHFTKMYNLWSKLNDDQKIELRYFIQTFVPFDGRYFGKKERPIYTSDIGKECPAQYNEILDKFEEFN